MGTDDDTDPFKSKTESDDEDDETENDLQGEEGFDDSSTDPPPSIYSASVPVSIIAQRRPYISPSEMEPVVAPPAPVKHETDDEEEEIQEQDDYIVYRRPTRSNSLKRHGEDDIFQVPNSYIDRYMSFRDDFFQKEKNS
jgi:hypothetical protein